MKGKKDFQTDWREAVSCIQQGGIAVLPTDTLYGIVASALSSKSVERVYNVREREYNKPCIILLDAIETLATFLHPKQYEQYEHLLSCLWPGPISIILPVKGVRWEYLHRGKESLAFRIPGDKSLQEILAKTGPIIAPSANKAGEDTAETVQEAKEIFRDAVDVYVDGGVQKGNPSTLISLLDGNILFIRKGSMSKEEVQRRVGKKYSV